MTFYCSHDDPLFNHASLRISNLEIRQMLNAHHKKMSMWKTALLFWHFVVSIYISCSEANLGVAVNDPCSSNPCWNAGTCVTNGSLFTCSCPQGFSGQKCEFHVTHCAVNPCFNGICRLSTDGLPECFCTPGFTGKFCDINEDECASQPCKNGALCVDEVNGYKCVCKGDTYGRHCEIHQRDIMQCVARCDEEPCWRNHTVMIPVKWGYDDSICSTSHSCFGGENDTEADLYDTFVEVQLKPLQIQLGDTLNFTADEEIVAYVDGFVPHHVVAANVSSAFRACNESNGIPLVNKPTNSVVVGLDILTLGTKYFIANIDSTFRCNFGLRLNVSVKESNCKTPSESEICSGRGQCSTNFSLPDFRCKCCGGFRGEFCEMVDYCFSKPCKNNAACQNRESSADGSTHVCICQPGYEGRDCSEIKDLCLSSPCLNGGSCISGVNNFTCHCARGFSGRNCEVDINECASSPCFTGSTCVDGVGSFSCHCPAGFTGSYCEVEIDECLPSPCVQGTCIDQVNSFKCHCSPGYAGIKCDYNLKECLSNPCHNGGSCVDEVNGFRCDCGPGYRGDHCEIDVDLCKEPMMCINSLSCIDKGQSVQCSCKAGFTGYNCAVNINDCLSHPCENGGTCRDKINDFECICPDGFTGKACEVNINDCLSDPCMNGGTCRDEVNDFKCICPYGFTGKACEESTETTPAPQFNRQFTLKLMTEDCNLLKGSLVGTHIIQGIASSMAESCNCSFDTGHIVAASVLLQCRDRISAEMSMELRPANEQSVDKLICQFNESLYIQHKNVINVGYNTYAVRVLSDVSTCGHPNGKVNVKDTRTEEKGGASKGGNIAVTIASVCAAVGLIVAAVIVCLKCRRAPPSVKKRPSKGENELIEDLSADLLSAVAPTPKSMYRTSGGYHNMAFSGRFNPENPVKSRRV